MPDLLLQVKILNAASADRPVLERAVMAKTEVLGIVSYGSADFSRLFAPPNFGK